MKSKLLTFTLICFLASLPFQYSAGQESADSLRLIHIETVEGNEFTGYLISKDPEKLTISTKTYGTISISLKDIRTTTFIDDKLIRNGEVWMDNLQATRYFWQPNGYGLKQGEGYYQNIWVMFSQASLGLTDNFSVGVGMVPLFLFQGPSPAWIAPKVSIPVVKDKFNIGGGVLAGAILGEDGTTFGIAYGVATLGDRDANANFGLGYGFADGEWATAPLITFSAMVRAGRRNYFITENYFIGLSGDNFGLIMLGGRTVWPRISLDYGGVIPVNLGTGLIAIPWLGFSIPFGNN